MTETYYAMVVSPHPDDAEFGVAGTVVKWVRQGQPVMYVVCTNGDKGSSNRDMTSEKLARIREEEQKAAAMVLGVGEVIFLRHADQGLEDTPQFREEIVRLVRTYRPEIVATCDPYRRYIWHRDHRVTGQVVLDAVFPYARDRLAYPGMIEKGLEPHYVKEVLTWGADEPDYFSDITETFEVKMAALRCHRSQFGDIQAEWEKRIRDRHETMAEGQAFPLAEAFHRTDLTLYGTMPAKAHGRSSSNRKPIRRGQRKR